MELKPSVVLIQSSRRLLIVPYGIETSELKDSAAELALLIVPYGIETTFCCYKHKRVNFLLIVPYGIETAHKRHAGDMQPAF